MRVPLIGGAREPAEGVLVRTRYAHTRRVERAHVELRIVIARSRRLQVAVGHIPIERGIRAGAARTCQQDHTANNRPNGTLHEMT